jgi:hypothetical protein
MCRPVTSVVGEHGDGDWLHGTGGAITAAWRGLGGNVASNPTAVAADRWPPAGANAVCGVGGRCQPRTTWRLPVGVSTLGRWTFGDAGCCGALSMI